MEKYSFFGLDTDNTVQVYVETDKLYTSLEANAMYCKLTVMFPELQFDYQQR